METVHNIDFYHNLLTVNGLIAIVGYAAYKYQVVAVIASAV